MQKRLIIGILATLGIAAFGLIPTDQLRVKPDKPMFFYVVPLLRIKVCEKGSSNATFDLDLSLAIGAGSFIRVQVGHC